MNINDNKLLLLKVSNIAIKAGNKIMEFYNQKNEIIIKEDQSPLTKADIASNKIIFKELKNINSSISILSEETLVRWSERKNWNTYWLIDPLDGTKEFISRNGEFTVNIALIENHTPILGVIYAPALSVLYYGSKNCGSFKIDCDAKIDSLTNSIKIKTNEKKDSDHFQVFESRSHSNQEFTSWVKNNVHSYDLVKRGSSIKFCEIAEGKVDLYPRFGPTSEWDIAAGHIILTEAGGEIKNVNQNKLKYNLKESLINPHFIASCKYI
jgi:3'(2'), 5'-bisphosphate nucleotidase